MFGGVVVVTLGCRYRLDSLLGQGGMGQLRRASDSRHQCHVAGKLLHPGLMAGTRCRGRFEHEASSVLALQHPRIVPMQEFGQIDSQLCVAMALLAGHDLDGLFRQDGLLASDAACSVIKDGAAALDAAHSMGLVHLDIKSTNVSMHASGQHVHVIHFSIAHAEDKANLSSGSRPIGTHAYMAPERYDGISGPAEDIYALTGVLFECLMESFFKVGTTVNRGVPTQRPGPTHRLAEKPASNENSAKT